MAATAAHLVDRALQGSLRRIFVHAVTSGQARRARSQGQPPDALGYRSGAINLIQRAGGALNLNPHFHAPFLEGVYSRGFPLAPPREPRPPASDRSIARSKAGSRWPGCAERYAC